EYRSLSEPEAIVRRVDAKPAFYVGHSNPHPRIPPGPFEVVWTGIIHLQESAPISLSAFCGGDLTVDIDGAAALRGRGETDTSELKSTGPFKRESGFYRITIRYRSIKNVPARLQLFWEGLAFSRELIPAWKFHHVAADRSPELKKSMTETTGRAIAGRYGCARCHSEALPGVTDQPPGPSLAEVGQRVTRTWLMNWLADPAKIRTEARMPALFSADPMGHAERWIIADYLMRDSADKRDEKPPQGDHRAGRLAFLNLGCAA